ncbi:MAG: NAD(P)/FAD-dependent oxidoreductase [Desulfobacterales bacterium]
METYDVAVIGTGTAAYQVVYPCCEADLRVAVVDRRPYGGTCAIRGCQPKKYLVAAAGAVERAEAMAGIGIRRPSQINWPDLLASKNAFTHSVPRRTEEGFQDAGAATFHGPARFTGNQTLKVGEAEIRAEKIVIPSGAKPRPLDFPGAHLMASSDDFLDLEALPPRIVFVGGGFISMEFAHVAARAGSQVTVLQQDAHVLNPFDSDLSDLLVEASRAAGITIETGVCVNEVVPANGGFKVRCRENPNQTFSADLVVHGAGRVPDLEDLDLSAAGINFTPKGVTVDDYLQSPSNPRIYAIGDAVATPYQLAPIADMEGLCAAHNILHGNQQKADYSVVPSAVFTQPPLAAVGILAAEAKKLDREVAINSGDMTSWPSSRRIGQRHAAYKVIIDSGNQQILGAHILGHNADEMINIFALAMRFNLTRDDLKSMLWAYPTYISDIKYML